jgi:hypothetical protein
MFKVLYNPKRNQYHYCKAEEVNHKAEGWELVDGDPKTEDAAKDLIENDKKGRKPAKKPAKK